MKKNKVQNTIFDNIPEKDTTEEDIRFAEKEKKLKKAAFKKANRAMDRIFGFMLAAVFAIGIGGLGLVYMLEKGPSQALNDKFINSMLETRRFDFMASLFLDYDELAPYNDTGEAEQVLMNTELDTSLITISETKTDENGADAYGLIDDDGDGVIYEKFTYHGSTCYMIVVLDPSRVFVGVTNPDSGWGLVLDEMVEKYDARGGINAGIFVDTNGAGTGWPPCGITISEGVTYESDLGGGCVAGLSEDGILYVGYLTYEDCVNTGIRDAVMFYPILVQNGEMVDESLLEGGISSRTCIGQRADGAIVMLVVDGRQAYSIGISQKDAAEIMFNYGCINALNMDGGNSSSMYLDGELKNHPSNPAGGTRYLPDAWLFR